jgi:cyanophycinase
MLKRSQSLGAIVLGAALLLLPAVARSQEATEYGPAKGTLLIVGGGSLKDVGIYEKFIELAGGKDARIVVVPTAGGNKNTDGSLKVYKEDEVLKGWKARGLTHVTMVHTADPKVANTPEFVKPITEANAVWFEGGRQWNIVDSYANTLAEKEFHRVLERGGVIGGSSAGATIQGDFLVRGAVKDNTTIVSPEPEHHKGFAFLRQSAIDQHINTRLRWDDINDLIKDHPELLGIGLSENTAIIVHGDRFEVIGAWKVAVHDNTRIYQPWEKPYYVLSVGDVYNMKTRKIEKFGIGSSEPPQGGQPRSTGANGARPTGANAAQPAGANATRPVEASANPRPASSSSLSAAPATAASGR